MAKGKLGYVCYVIMPGGVPVPVKELTDSERAQWQQNMMARLTEDMSAYYTQHPDEYAAL